MVPKRFALVCGYGCHLNDSIKRYLNDVVSWCYQNPDAIVILSGGFTNKKTMPGISEASMMRDYLTKRFVTNRVILDEEAILSIDNIRNTAKMLKGIDRDLVVFCDSIRVVKMWIMGLIYLDRFTLVTHNFHRSTREKLSQIIRTIIEISFIILRPLEWIARKQRIALNKSR